MTYYSGVGAFRVLGTSRSSSGERGATSMTTDLICYSYNRTTHNRAHFQNGRRDKQGLSVRLGEKRGEGPLMGRKAIGRMAFLFLGLAVLVSCTLDPEKRKFKYLNSGETYAKQGKYREASLQFRNAIQIDPKFAEGHYQLAMAYLALSDGEDAYKEFQRAVSLNPGNLDGQLQLATLEIAHRQYDQAQAAVETVLAADPKNSGLMRFWRKNTWLRTKWTKPSRQCRRRWDRVRHVPKP